ncbi:hypothetical protein KFK09_021656 [Dendrobium nobile]|uniref:Uncharacterized protein n=1 Tax=Dendrobium nobile TaxID=94219 RepID=A0A8T3AQY2_DENNO|nr:hypothetical protein KFK09_021656 [Dendrobium nobile]
MHYDHRPPLHRWSPLPSSNVSYSSTCFSPQLPACSSRETHTLLLYSAILSSVVMAKLSVDGSGDYSIDEKSLKIGSKEVMWQLRMRLQPLNPTEAKLEFCPFRCIRREVLSAM